MTKIELLERLEQAPVIAAVKDTTTLAAALESAAGVVFVLYGTVVSLPAIVTAVHSAGKAAIVHLDLIDGLSAREAAVDYIAEVARADGLITTKPGLLQRANKLGLLTVRRFFLLDSMALHQLENPPACASTDFIELLPGVIPGLIQTMAASSGIPLIAGGLIQTKKDAQAALAAGAVAVSTTSAELWNS